MDLERKRERKREREQKQTDQPNNKQAYKCRGQINKSEKGAEFRTTLEGTIFPDDSPLLRGDRHTDRAHLDSWWRKVMVVVVVVEADGEREKGEERACKQTLGPKTEGLNPVR